MFVVALVYGSFALAGGLIATAWHNSYAYWLAWFVYYALFEFLHRAHWLHSPALRGGWLARAVRYWFDVSFTPEANQVLADINEQIAAGHQFIFACEPHAPQCLQLTLGFAAHGGALPALLGRCTFVVAHASTRFIPIVREIFSAYGVISASRQALEAVLGSGYAYSLALIPSGVYGKEHALLDRARHDGSVTVYRSRERFGFLYLAAKYKCSVVPVLSPDEMDGYTMFLQQFRAWPLVLPVGRHLLAPYVPVRIHVGKPIYAGAYDYKSEQQMELLANVYYSDLAALAPGRVHIRVIEDCE